MRYQKLMLSSALVAMLAIAGCGQSGSAPESAAETQTAGGNGERGCSGSGTPAAPKFESIVLPAGTSIEVTVDQAVSSKTNNAGDRFAASVATPVVVNGKQVIRPRASIVRGA